MSKKTRKNKQKNHQKKKHAKILRRKQKKSQRSISTLPTRSKQDGNIFKENCIFRFFFEKWQAEALTNGYVWISTLETCRGYENPEQGDPGEATMTYNSGKITGDGDNPDVQLIAKRSGISIGKGCSNITMSNNICYSRLPDGYVLCTTDDFLPGKLSKTFGMYCVKINNPKLFFKRVTECFGQQTKLNESIIGKVVYDDRFYKHTENPPGPIGFVKPKDKYSDQSEVRMLWIPESCASLKPFSLQCHEVSELCERIA